MSNIDDFGFSLVTEEELREQEEILKQKLHEQTQVVQQTQVQLTDKLHQLRDMVMPLLVNLTKDPEKSYLFWPNRVEKVNAFIDKINDFVDTD